MDGWASVEASTCSTWRAVPVWPPVEHNGWGRLGATVSGLDASAALIDIARRRAPSAELVAGDMFALPRPGGSFDAVTSFNGIWGGCTDALREARRVLRPGGGVGLTFWGRGDRLDLRDWFIALGSSTPHVGEEMISLASTPHSVVQQPRRKTMTITEKPTVDTNPVDNGVNVEALLGAREALTQAPPAAAFTWRARCDWQHGTHSRTHGPAGHPRDRPGRPHGFSAIRVSFDIDADATDDEIKALVA